MELISHEFVYLLKYLGLFILGVFLIPTTWKYLTDEQSNLLLEADELVSQFWSLETVRKNFRTTEEWEKIKKAVQIYRTLINKKPGTWQAYLSLGRTQRAISQPLEAKASLAKAYDLMPERLEVIVEYVQASLESNDLSTAYTVLKPTIKSFPDSYLLKKQLIIFLLLSNQPRLTLKQLDIFKDSGGVNNPDMQSFRLFAHRLQDGVAMPPSDIHQLFKAIGYQG